MFHILTATLIGGMVQNGNLLEYLDTMVETTGDRLDIRGEAKEAFEAFISIHIAMSTEGMPDIHTSWSDSGASMHFYAPHADRYARVCMHPFNERMLTIAIDLADEDYGHE